MMRSDIARKSCRNEILKFAAQQYHTEPEYLWRSQPDYAVLRHEDNKKWYAVLMNVPNEKLGLSGLETADILVIKCDPDMGSSLRMAKGFLPAYHMNHDKWISVLLDGTVKKKQILSLLEMSFDLTAGRHRSQPSPQTGNREWIVPANPAYYDLENAFSDNGTILWKQSTSIQVDDLVYLYVAAPVSALCYQCRAVEVNIPYDYDDKNVHMKRVMKIQLLNRLDRQQFCLERLKEHGVSAVRGPRHVPGSLSREIHLLCGGH